MPAFDFIALANYSVEDGHLEPRATTTTFADHPNAARRFVQCCRGHLGSVETINANQKRRLRDDRVFNRESRSDVIDRAPSGFERIDAPDLVREIWECVDQGRF